MCVVLYVVTTTSDLLSIPLPPLPLPSSPSTLSVLPHPRGRDRLQRVRRGDPPPRGVCRGAQAGAVHGVARAAGGGRRIKEIGRSENVWWSAPTAITHLSLCRISTDPMYLKKM